MDLPGKGKGDVLVLWKAPNLVKVLSWQQKSNE
jgi:hypothetical protein